MARKRHSDEDILKLLREIELKLANGSDEASACRGVGISDATNYNWRKRFGGLGRSRYGSSDNSWGAIYNPSCPHSTAFLFYR